MEMSLQQLRMLREVANRNTIAAAADSLGYTSSAVSQQLSGLEKATGVVVAPAVSSIHLSAPSSSRNCRQMPGDTMMDGMIRLATVT